MLWFHHHPSNAHSLRLEPVSCRRSKLHHLTTDRRKLAQRLCDGYAEALSKVPAWGIDGIGGWCGAPKMGGMVGADFSDIPTADFTQHQSGPLCHWDNYNQLYEPWVHGTLRSLNAKKNTRNSWVKKHSFTWTSQELEPHTSRYDGVAAVTFVVASITVAVTF